MDAIFDCAAKRELTAQEIAAIPAPPRAALAIRKTNMWDRVKARRDRVVARSVTVGPLGTFDADAESRANITGAVTMALIAQGAGQPFSINWKLANNAIATLNAAQMIAVGVAVGQHVAATHANAQSLGIAIDAAATHQDLDAIDVAAGWP